MKNYPKEFNCKDESSCPYAKKLKELKEELAYVRFELEQLRSKRYKTGKPPPAPDTPELPAPKKKGGLFGHIGWFRKKTG